MIFYKIAPFFILNKNRRLFIKGKRKDMKVNINHPSFITFLDNVTSNVLTNISVEKYFSLSPENKLGIQFMVFKLMKNSIKTRAKLTDLEMKSFIIVLQKKNEESENYELAEILKDMSINFDTVNEITKPAKRTVRKIKTDTNTKSE